MLIVYIHIIVLYVLYTYTLLSYISIHTRDNIKHHTGNQLEMKFFLSREFGFCGETSKWIIWIFHISMTYVPRLL